jgi:transcriptional regulator with XRE-family HTH domain
MKSPDKHAARIKVVFARNVKILRERNGLTQEELAERSGMHRVTIARIETNVTHPSFCEACLIADVLGVSVSQLRVEIWDGQ